MATPRSAWGIDLGNRALKAIKLVQTSEGPQIEDFEIIEHEQILSNAGDNKEGLLQTALANFVQHKIPRGSPVAISVSGQSSFARFIKLPPVEPKKIPEIVRFEAIQQIPFPLDDVEWSYQLFQSPDNPDVEVGIFAMRKELVDRQVQYFTSLKMNVQAVQMAPLAVYNAMYFDKRVSGATMFMDAGAETTDLIIADGETVWLRTLPIGGNNFTEALAKSFKLNFAKAEDLKRNAATSKYARQIFQAMRPIFADMVAEVQRSIGFYSSVHRESRIAKICAMGGTFRLPGLQKYLQQNLQLDVERVESFKAGVPGDPKAATAFSENAISMAGPYGLALQGLGLSKITSSLLPSAIRRAKMWREKTKWFAIASAACVAAAGLVGFRVWTDTQAFMANVQTRKQIADTISNGTTLSKQWAVVQNMGGPEREKILEVRHLEDYRDLWPQMLMKLNSVLPQNQPGAPQITPSTPRALRNEIVVQKIRTAYRTDMANVIDPKLDNNNFAQMAGGADAEIRGAAGDQHKRGFLMTIDGWTTKPADQSAQFLDERFIKPLRAFNEAKAIAEKKQFYVGRVQVIKVGKRTLPARPPAPAPPVAQPVFDPNAPPGAPRAVEPPPAPLLTPPEYPKDAENDTEFEILLAFVLDPVAKGK